MPVLWCPYLIFLGFLVGREISHVPRNFEEKSRLTKRAQNGPGSYCHTFFGLPAPTLTPTRHHHTPSSMESKEDLDLARERELADSVTKRKHTIAFLEATLQEQRSLCASEEQRIAFMQGQRAGRSVHAEPKKKRRRLDPPPLSLSLSAVPEDDAEADPPGESFQESLQAEAADADDDDDEDEPMVVGKSSRRPIRITDSESDSEEKEHQPPVDDGDEKEPAQDEDAGEEEHKAIVLLPDQEKRKAVQYEPGELVLVEWDTTAEGVRKAKSQGREGSQHGTPGARVAAHE
jgi:hypothetical protein